jgi:hypothetical protein
MSAMLCGVDQIIKAALPIHKAQDVPDRERLVMTLIIKDIYTFSEYAHSHFEAIFIHIGNAA